MQDVVVLTLPPRNFTYGLTATYNDTVNYTSKPLLILIELHVLREPFSVQINDYVAGYHDGALLFGQMTREWLLSQREHERTNGVPLMDNPFGNASFYGTCVH